MLRDTSKELSSETLDLLADLDSVHETISRGWCRGAFHRVTATDGTHRYCLLGALRLLSNYSPARNTIKDQISIETGLTQSIDGWNDHEARNQTHVLGLIERAKARVLAEAKAHVGP